jgi:hypothetical protein
VRDFQKLDEIQSALSSLELRNERLRPFQLLGKACLRETSVSACARQ